MPSVPHMAHPKWGVTQMGGHKKSHQEFKMIQINKHIRKK